MPRDTESTTKFKVDISDFKKSMQEAARLTRLAESEFKAATAGMGKWSDSVDGVSAKLKQLDKVLGAQKTKLTVLEREYEEVVKEQGASSKAAQELQIKINNQTAAIKKTEADMKHYGERLNELTSDTTELGDATVESGKDAKKGAEGFTVMKGALASLVADGIKLAIKGLKNLSKEAINAYKEFDDGADIIIKVTGATGEAAESLIKSYEKVAGSIKGDFSSIGETLGEINTRMGLTDEELEKATVDFTKFAEVTGTDAKEAVRLVSRAMGDAGIDVKEYSGLLDELTTAAQSSGLKVDKLAEMLTSYGAPMRQLGFDTKESIALFSAWEKAGVNTSTAFSGLRQAIGGWAKDGKDARKEFKKALDLIAKTPNISKATEKAIETFGKKAGPDLADAIYGGRFEYSQFVELLDNSKDSVSKAYEATQDGFDKVQVAIQRGRIKLAKIVDNLLQKYEPQITRFVAKATKGAEKLFDAVENGIKFIIKNKNAVLSALAGIASAFVVYKTVTTITAVVTAFKGLITAIKAGQSATVALNAVMSASPWGLVAAGVSAVVVGLISYASATKKAKLEQYGLTEAQQDSIDKSKEIADEYKAMDSARIDNNSAIANEYSYLKDLKKEYNKLIDKNGEIKRGYETRAHFILNQLAEAMGVERDEIEKTIGENGKLGKSLDDLMIKQQAQALLESNKQYWAEAIDVKKGKLVDYQNAITTATAREEEFNKALKEAGITAEDFKNAISARDNGDVETWARYYKGIGQENLEIIETTYNAYKEASDALTEVENAYVGANQTIENYEGLSAAVLEGDAKKIQEATQKLQNNLISAEAGNERLLTAQSIKVKIAYQDMQEALDKGMAGVTKTDVKNAKKLVSTANAELLKYLKGTDTYKELKRRGYKLGDTLAEGMDDGSIRVGDVTQKLVDLLDLDRGYGTAGIAKTARALGLEIPDEIVQGLLSGQYDVTEADRKMSAVIIKALEDTAKDAGIEAEEIPESVKGAVVEGEKTISEAVEEMKNGVFDAMLDEDGEATSKGEKIVTDYSDALINGKKAVEDAGKEVAESAENGLETGDSEESGENFVQGFINGIKKKVEDTGSGSLHAWASKVAQTAIDAIRKTQQEGSPSKITYQSGRYFAQGYINGIKSLTGEVGKVVAELTKTAIKQLKKGESIDFTFDFDRSVEATEAYLTNLTEQKKQKYDQTIEGLEKQKNSTNKKLEKEKEAEEKAVRKSWRHQIKERNKYWDGIIKAEQDGQKRYEEQRDKELEGLDKKRSEADSKEEREYYAKKKTERQKYWNGLIDQSKENEKKYETQRDNEIKGLEKKSKQEQKAVRKLYNKKIKENENYFNALIKQENAEKENFEKASEIMMTNFTEASNEYATKAEQLINDTIQGVTDAYQEKYDALMYKQEELTNKMKDFGELFNISTAGVLEINDLNEQTKQLQEYADKLYKIKGKVSSELFDKIASYDVKEGSAFLTQLLSMSDEEIAAYDKAYTDKINVANTAGEKMFNFDFKIIKKEFEENLRLAFAELPAMLEELGQEMMQSFIKGMKDDSAYTNKAIKKIIKNASKTIKNSQKKNETGGLFDNLGEIFKSTKTAVDSAMKNLSVSVDSKAPTTSTATTVTNNYNLVQNNTSPKSLSALETYQARRQQLAMLKAL